MSSAEFISFVLILQDFFFITNKILIIWQVCLLWTLHLYRFWNLNYCNYLYLFWIFALEGWTFKLSPKEGNYGDITLTQNTTLLFVTHTLQVFMCLYLYVFIKMTCRYWQYYLASALCISQYQYYGWQNKFWWEQILECESKMQYI